MAKEVSKGSVVRLKSGGCEMTVLEIKIKIGAKAKTSVSVIWFNGNHFDRETIPLECLEVVR